MERPNVVMIVADTFRRDHLGAYGNPFISTPHIDEFARSLWYSTSMWFLLSRRCRRGRTC